MVKHLDNFSSAGPGPSASLIISSSVEQAMCSNDKSISIISFVSSVTPSTSVSLIPKKCSCLLLQKFVDIYHFLHDKFSGKNLSHLVLFVHLVLVLAHHY